MSGWGWWVGLVVGVVRGGASTLSTCDDRARPSQAPTPPSHLGKLPPSLSALRDRPTPTRTPTPAPDAAAAAGVVEFVGFVWQVVG